MVWGISTRENNPACHGQAGARKPRQATLGETIGRGRPKKGASVGALAFEEPHSVSTAQASAAQVSMSFLLGVLCMCRANHPWSILFTGFAKCRGV